MHRNPWSEDPKEILELINSAIAGRLPATLQIHKSPGVRTRILKIHYHQDRPYLLLAKPQELGNGRFVREVLFKMKGLPVLGFSCPVTREADTLLATMLPHSIFQLELRKHQRYEPLKGSMTTFFTRGGSRVSICMMENICMGGVKLSGSFAHNIAVNDIVGPCTLSLAGRDALISREVTVNKAKIVRLENGIVNENQQGLGIKFDLEDYEEIQLKEHIEFLSHQK